MKRSLLISLPMLLVTGFLFFAKGHVSNIQLYLKIFVFSFINTLFFLMIYQRKVQRWRSILFTILAFSFVIHFVSSLLEQRGSMFITPDLVYQNKVPFCPLVITTTLLPMLFKKIILFPGSLLEGKASIGTMVVLWMSITILLGRGFCSWFCFFGGLEEGVARIPTKSRVNLSKTWKYLPWSILLVSSLLSFALFSPVYCVWLCPFKAVTEFHKIVSFESLMQFIAFFSVFMIFILILPFLTKKRAQCGYFCPFGALQSITNKFSLFAMRLDENKCKKCFLCLSKCPINCLEKKHVLKGKMPFSCMKCGSCIDACPQKAICYHVKGCLPNKNYNLLFLYPAFLILAIMSEKMISSALYRLFLLITTGSLLNG